MKSKNPLFWRINLHIDLNDEPRMWWDGLNYEKIKALSYEEYEKLYIDRWFDANKKDNNIHSGLFSCDNFILQVHGYIQHEKVIVSINPSGKHNFLNVNLNKSLQVPTQNIQNTQVEGENVQFFKDLKITMDKYVLHSNFSAIDMDDVDIVLGYIWMDSLGTININVRKNFLKLWYKKIKIIL
jgi:hypothetical protein